MGSCTSAYKGSTSNVGETKEEYARTHKFNSLDDFPTITVSNKQFGQKGKEHAKEFGYDITTPEGRESYRNEIERIRKEAQEVRVVNWRGKGEFLCYSFKDSDRALITKLNGEFVTLFVDYGNKRISGGIVLWTERTLR